MYRLMLVEMALVLALVTPAMWVALIRGAAKGKLVPLQLELPGPGATCCWGRPRPRASDPMNVEPIRNGPRPALMVPKGLVNVAFRKRVTSSDKDPIIGDLERVTDGDKEMGSESSVELGPGLQYVQVDLGERHEIYAVVFWFNYHCSRIFHDVVVQVADDCDFIANVKTLFSNDYDNSSGLGVGPDLEYYDTYEGKLLGAKGVVARYVRVYSRGSTVDEFKRFTEVEVYGRPVKWF